MWLDVKRHMMARCQAHVEGDWPALQLCSTPEQQLLSGLSHKVLLQVH
jgi:hypothetical protein